MSVPLVTVVTATWQRPRTIMERAIPSLAAQDYPGDRIQHLIVTDGHDPGLNAVLHAAGYSESDQLRKLVNMGRNWSGPEARGGCGVAARLVGAWLAAGEYTGYLDDDNTYLPHHVRAMAAALESSGADFATSRWRMGAPGSFVMGDPNPGRGRTDTTGIMHKTSILPHGDWRMDGYESDGALVERWLANGRTHVHVPEATFVLYPHRYGAPDGPRAVAV